MAKAFSVYVDNTRLEAALDHLADKVDKAARPAAQAGAEHMYFEARLRAPESKHAHWFHGTNDKYFFRSGTLRDALYQVYSKDNSGYAKATYHVAWNHKKAPYGFMVEFGTSRAPAHPFLRPAYAASHGQAAQIAKAELEQRVAPYL